MTRTYARASPTPHLPRSVFKSSALTLHLYIRLSFPVSDVVSASNSRISSSLTLLSTVIKEATESARRGQLTNDLLQQLVLRVGLFPYIPWQVGRGYTHVYLSCVGSRNMLVWMRRVVVTALLLTHCAFAKSAINLATHYGCIR